MPTETRTHRLRVLDFDMETRPLAVWFDGRCTWEPTAIAWAWDNEKIHVRALPEMPADAMLTDFLNELNIAADNGWIVTGHNIRDFDLPVLVAACAENGLPALRPVLSHDTLRDLSRMKDLSRSQENLGIMLGLRNPKAHMANADWREANRMTAEGVKRTRERVTADVKQHRELRRVLLARGLLGPPRMWRP